MSLDNSTSKQFRAIGHQLSPIVIIANGLSDNINSEISRALNDHELIKIKVNCNDREEKRKLVDKICSKHNAILVQLIGHVALLFKAAKKPNPKLSNLIRHQKLRN